uniref:ENTH domain-containing protein n=1 Tax=Macrostomum lignano TaxID=282301 RepID=A0A1I8JPN4_9PLAT
MNYTELEGKVREATNDEAWGPRRRVLLLLTYLIRPRLSRIPRSSAQGHEAVEFIQDDDKLSRGAQKLPARIVTNILAIRANSFSGGSGFGSGDTEAAPSPTTMVAAVCGCGGSQLGEIDDWEGGRYRTMKDDVIDRVKDIWRRSPAAGRRRFQRVRSAAAPALAFRTTAMEGGGNGHLQAAVGIRLSRSTTEPTSGSSSTAPIAEQLEFSSRANACDLRRRSRRLESWRRRQRKAEARRGASVIDLSGSASAGANDDVATEFADFQSAGAQRQLSKQQENGRGSVTSSCGRLCLDSVKQAKGSRGTLLVSPTESEPIVAGRTDRRILPTSPQYDNTDGGARPAGPQPSPFAAAAPAGFGQQQPRPAVYQAQPAAAPQLKSPTSPTYPTSVNWGSGGAGSGGIGGARRAPSLQAKADQAFADLVSLK